MIEAPVSEVVRDYLAPGRQDPAKDPFDRSFLDDPKPKLQPASPYLKPVEVKEPAPEFPCLFSIPPHWSDRVQCFRTITKDAASLEFGLVNAQRESREQLAGLKEIAPNVVALAVEAEAKILELTKEVYTQTRVAFETAFEVDDQLRKRAVELEEAAREDQMAADATRDLEDPGSLKLSPEQQFELSQKARHLPTLAQNRRTLVAGYEARIAELVEAHKLSLPAIVARIIAGAKNERGEVLDRDVLRQDAGGYFNIT
jgi:hypothetical protein